MKQDKSQEALEPDSKIQLAIIQHNVERWRKEKEHRLKVKSGHEFQEKFNRIDERAHL